MVGSVQPISLLPIGVVRSPFTTQQGTPLQTVAAFDIEAVVELDPHYAPALRGLEGFSHCHLLTFLDRAEWGGRLEVVPFLDDEAHGVFATRAPGRPNPIGLSLVRLVAVEGATLRVAGIDLLDGTPVLDLKPYVPPFDQVEATSWGWLERRAAEVHRTRADDRFGKRAG